MILCNTSIEYLLLMLAINYINTPFQKSCFFQKIFRRNLRRFKIAFFKKVQNNFSVVKANNDFYRDRFFGKKKFQPQGRNYHMDTRIHVRAHKSRKKGCVVKSACK